MNISLLSHEMLVVLLAAGVLLADLWLPASARRQLGWVAVLGLLGILIWSLCCVCGSGSQTAFGNMFVLDGLALFFKRFFLLATALVLVIAMEFSDRFRSGHAEFHGIALLALAGMLFASSVNDFALLFVSLELVTLSFYVLTSFQRSRVLSLEAGVKYLIIGALSTGFTVFGIALVFGTTGSLDFSEVARVSAQMIDNKLFLLGLLLVVVGLAFKIAIFPLQIWAPDVYQGAPTPTTAFLAVGSKGAGIVLLLRVLFTAVPAVAANWSSLLIVVGAVTILYGNLGALPQINIKRMLGYSSIAHAGYLMLGIAALNQAGKAAVLFYLGGYLFTVLAAFAVIAVVLRHADTEDISGLAGLHQREPLLAAGMLFAMVSLAGIPPFVGFFGKFLLIKAALAQAPADTGYYWLVAAAVVGVVISLYYYFGVVRVMYWSTDAADAAAVRASWPVRAMVALCMAGILVVGIFPGPLLNWANVAVQSLQ